MPDVTPSRRAVLTGVLALGVATPLLRGAPAAAGPAAMPFRSLHRLTLGDMTLSVIDDARVTFPAPIFAANQPEDAMPALLQRHGLPQEAVSFNIHVTLVETAGRKVLLDTGMGDITFPGNVPDNGRLIAGLAALGVKPEEITDVIISHGHPDHIGGCSLAGIPCFPKAIYHIAGEELEYWTQKPGSDENFTNMMLAIGNAKLGPIQGLIRTYSSGESPVPGITAIAAPGHTLGHHAFHLESGGASLLHLMDAAVHYLSGVEEPEWAFAFEMDPGKAAATRHMLFRRAVEKDSLVAGYHFPFPGIGRLVEAEKGWRFVPVQTA